VTLGIYCVLSVICGMSGVIRHTGSDWIVYRMNINLESCRHPAAVFIRSTFCTISINDGLRRSVC
jgi:hypothetical protein